MMEDLVSIILPTYNRAYCLPRTIDSIQSQSYKNYEIIIVDDGSSDTTHEVVEKYLADKRVKYYRQTNAGVSAARNNAIRYANGEYLAFCDSDDIWDEYKLELQVACMKAYPSAGLVWTEASAVDQSGTVLHQRYTRNVYYAWKSLFTNNLFHTIKKLNELGLNLPETLNESEFFVGDILSALVEGNVIVMPTAMVRSSLVEKVGYFDESMTTGEDYDFNMRISKHSQAIFVDHLCVKYRINAADSLTRPELYVDTARNTLRTILPVISQSKDRLQLSDEQIAEILARRYRLLGNAEFEAENWRAARSALLKSLYYDKFQKRAYILVLLCLLPGWLINGLRTIYGKLKLSRAANSSC